MKRRVLSAFLCAVLTTGMLLDSGVSVAAAAADSAVLAEQTENQEEPEVTEIGGGGSDENPAVNEEVSEETDTADTYVAAEAVTIKQTELELMEGETALIEAVVTPENASNKNLVYTSDNEEVAVVDANGNVTCVAEGTAAITVASEEDGTICACVLVTGLPAAGVLAETNYNFVPDSFSESTVADWKFDSDYFKSGTLEDGNLVIGDASGNGNDLMLNTERVAGGKTAADYMAFQGDSIYGDAETESLWMTPEGLANPAKKQGAFFETIPGAAMNDEEFRDGYTIEAIIKLPQSLSNWSSVFGQKGTGKLAGMIGGEPEANGGLNISGSGELQWNVWTTNNAEIQDNPTTWSDAGGIQRDKWHHVVVKNDGHSTVMIVDGIQVQRCNTFTDQVGIKSLNVGGQKAWVVGTAYWSEANTFSEAGCGDAIFRGNIQRIRMSKGLIDPSEYLVTEHVIDSRYNISGDNTPYPDLAGKNNYTFSVIPDPQYQTQYKAPIVDAQTEWIRDNADRLNIGMTLCVGDLSQDGTEREFNLADKAFSVLDEANIPYLITDGNHDGDVFKELFSGARYEGDPGYQGAGPSGVSNYSIIRAGSYEYLFLSLPWMKKDLAADREWILNVLDTHREYPTVVFSHFNEDVETFVKPFDQVFMTVRGHIEDRWVRGFKNNYGHDVIDLVTNFQFDLYGGNGWMTNVEFDEAENQITFRTYSPWVEKKMRILNGEIGNNGILLSDEMQLFPFDKLVNTSKETDNTTVSINFAERLPKGTMVSMEDLDLKADLLKEKISAAERTLEKANKLQYTAEDIKALETVLAEAKELYAAYEAVNPVTPIEALEALKENMIAEKNVLTQAINTFEDAAKPVTKIAVIGGDFTMNVNETKELEAVVGPETAVTKDVVWTSSNESVAVVDKNGKVTALKEGTALITATTTDGSNLTAFAFVTINQPAKGVVISKEKATLRVGSRMQLSAKVTEGTNKDIVWVSGNPEIATVDQFGMVTALKEGEVEIAAVAADGMGAYAVCAVTVTGDKSASDDDNKTTVDNNKTPNNGNKTPNNGNTTGTANPSTGDQNTTVMTTAVLMLIASLCVVIVLIARKKKLN